MLFFSRFGKFSKLKNLLNNLKVESWSCETRASRLNTFAVFWRWSPPPMMQPRLTPCQMVQTGAQTPRASSTPPHSLCKIQMPFPSARRAPSGPNKFGGVVYRELLNVNLAEPAAIAAVCGGMSVITQTDKHKHTQKAREGSDCTITHTQTLFFLMTNRLRRRFHVSAIWWCY